MRRRGRAGPTIGGGADEAVVLLLDQEAVNWDMLREQGADGDGCGGSGWYNTVPVASRGSEGNP